MNNFGKYVLTALGLNILSFVLLLVIVFASNSDGFSGLIIAFFIVAASLIIQAIIGLVYVLGEKKELGKAMLLSVGVILLIGLSLCSSA